MEQIPLDLVEESEKSLLASLLQDSELYHKSENYKALLEFTARLRNIAPFNAMLLHIQKPGLLYVSSRYEWFNRFGRTVNDGARPLLILWPFGPVAFVYDVADTDGEPLPEIVLNPFPATGNMTEWTIKEFTYDLRRKWIEVRFIEYGSGIAGNVEAKPQTEGTEIDSRSGSPKEPSHYIIRINKTHDPNVQFATLTHELAHLFLGHLGDDPYLKIPSRCRTNHDQRELEAESVSFLVCRRNGVQSKAEAYLADYVKNHETVENLDPYLLMKAAGQVEAVLGLGEMVRFTPKGKPTSFEHLR